MYLSRFGVKNYKCLGEIDIPLTPIHVLIGQNDCGKTSLLEAIYAFCATSDVQPVAAFPEPWIRRELVRHENPEPIVEMWSAWEMGGNYKTVSPYPRMQYGMKFTFNSKTIKCLVADQWIETNGEKRWLSRPGSEASDTSAKHWKETKSKPQKIDVVEEDLHAVSLIRPAHKYSLNAKHMALPAGYDPHRKFRLAPDGFGLSTLLDDLLGYDPELFIRLRTEFCSYFPQFKSIRIETVPALNRSDISNGLFGFGPAMGKGIFFEMASGQTIRAQQASDGAILFLAFLALSFLPNPPNLLLIEEPENGVYPKRLGQVIKLLKQLVHRAEGMRFPQIILTTHSPYVLSYFEPEEATFLCRPTDPPDAPVRARPLRDAPNIRERLGSEFYLGELWYNLSEEDLFGGA
jgi:hypothetical protein